jgi:hypothetical protein
MDANAREGTLVPIPRQVAASKATKKARNGAWIKRAGERTSLRGRR